MEDKVKPTPFSKKLILVFEYLRDRLDLHEDKENELETIDYIKKNVEFKGGNLWILIFAIFIASIGLNVNSTAVIIGAMLISPLMGPIMGIGLSAGINDFDLMKKSARNLTVAVFISILTSTTYFYLSPISDAQSELLARTEPNAWDVLIAFFGGLAGIVAGSRKDKSNAIPGVAIATALMPPLCTAGYGIATGNFFYFVGAFYLFFINSVFISLSTYLIVRFMRFPKKEFIDPKREKRVQSYITIVTLATIIPSVYLAFGLVRKSIWHEQARRFVSVEVEFPNTHVLKTIYTYDQDERTIEIELIGDPISLEQIDILEKKLPQFGLENTGILVLQNGSDQGSLQNDILRDFYEASKTKIATQEDRIAFLEEELSADVGIRKLSGEIAAEVKVNHPQLSKFSLGRSVVTDLKNNKSDTLLTALVEFDKSPPSAELDKLSQWLKIRTQSDTLALIVSKSTPSPPAK